MAVQERRLAGACRKVGDTARQILDWVDDSDALIPAERVALLHEVYRAGAAADRLASALGEAPSVAFVGPRRAGKTQLISALVERGGGPLCVRFEGIREQVAFGKHVCPDGGRLGGAAVIRLSGKSRPTAHNFPVSIRLLTVADLVKVIGGAWFAGAATGREQVPTTAALDALVAEARKAVLPEVVPGLAEEDIWEIRHYFTTRHADEPLVRALLAHGYWETLADVAGYLPNVARGRLLAPLWGTLAPMTRLFVALADTSGSLGYGQQASCALDAILGVDTRTGRLQRRADTVMGAQALTGLWAGLGLDAGPASKAPAEAASETSTSEGTGPTVMVSSQYAQWKSVPRAVLAAMLAEVALPVAGAPTDLLEKADLLEFPAIETATAAADLGATIAEDPHELGAVFMRAKAVYLLERYIEEQAITSMVVCIDPASAKVGALAGLVASWVERTHGGEAGQRELHANGLFVCFTKLDKEFVEPGRRAKERRTDWAKRLTTTLLDGLGRRHGWPREWTPGRPFDNVFLVRSPTYKAKHLCMFGNDGREMGFKPGQFERIERAREDFAADPLVRRHMADPVAAWNEALQLNDGGITFLAESLGEVCAARVKQRHVLNDLGTVGRSLRDRMQRYHVGDDALFQHDRRQVRAIVVARQLKRCAEAQRLGHLLRALQVGDDELSDVLRPDKPPATTAPATAAELASAMLTHWFGALRLLAHSDVTARETAMPKGGLQQLVDELIDGAHRLDLEARIISQIEAMTTAEDDQGHRAAKAAMCGANLIGEYVMWLGYNDAFSNSHPRRKGRAQTPIFPPRDVTDIWAAQTESRDGSDAFVADWTQAFVALVTANADRQVERQVEGEVETGRNERLGELLRQLDVVVVGHAS